MNFLDARKPKIAHLERDFVSSSLPPFHVTSAAPFPASASPFSSSYSNAPVRSLLSAQCHLLDDITSGREAKRHALADMFSWGVRS